MSVTIVSRAAWGARAPKRRYTIHTPTPRLWLHHTAGNEPDGAAGLRRIQNFHMNTRGWSDIAYSFVIDRRGVIYEGRGPGVAGGHTAGDNSTSHAICVIGNYDVQHPPQAVLDAIAALIRHGRAQGWWRDLTGGHRDARGASTACPGRHLYAAIPRIRQAAEGNTPPPRPQEDALTPELKKYLQDMEARITRDIQRSIGLTAKDVDGGRNLAADAKFLREGVRDLLYETLPGDDQRRGTLNPRVERLNV